MKKPLLLLLLSLIGMKASFSQTVDDPAGKSIDSLVHAYKDKGKIPGLSIVIVKDGSTFVRTYGYRDLAAKEPVTPLTLFELGSCSKAFTGLAALQMVKEHRLDPDAAVSDYLPWFKARYKDVPVKITISQLLHHTSGIPWKTISTIPQRQDANALEQTVRNVSGLSLHHLPGEQYEYATVNYDIVALIIQQLAGRPFESWLQDSIIHRLGLAHTSVGFPSDARQMALGYKTGFFASRLYHAPVFRGNYAAGYVISNAVDMGAWLRIQLGAGDSAMNVLTGLSHQRDESVPPAGLYSYAIGWQVSLSGNGEIVHTGENPNFTSYIAFRRVKNMGVAVLANSNSSYTPFIGDWIMRKLAGEVVKNDVDPDSGNDKIFSGISIVLGVFLITALVCLAPLLSAISHGRRRWVAPAGAKRGNLLFLTIFLSGVGYAIYLLPRIIGFSWEAICVWSPMSFITMVLLLAGGIAVGYLLYALSVLFPGDGNIKKEGAVIVGVCTIVGISNMALILLVTSSFHETGIPISYLAGYFLVLLSIYIYCRKFVQSKLIRISREIIHDTRMKLIDRILATSYEKFEKLDRGRIYSTLNNDIATVGDSANVSVMFVTSLITVTGIFIYLATVQLWASLLTIALILTMSVLYSITSKRVAVYFHAARDTQDVFMRLINGLIDGYKEISLHRRQKSEYKEDIAGSVKEFRTKTVKAELKFLHASLFGESSFIMLLGIVALGIPRFFPSIPSYSVMNFFLLLLYLNGPLNIILNAVPAVMQLRISWQRIQQFIRDIPAHSDPRKLPAPREKKTARSLVAEGIGFSYMDDDGSELFSLGPVDLELSKGEILFIVGGNGSGKTTLMKLLTGLYKINSGRVLIDGQEIKSSDLGEYFSVIFNPGYLFDKMYAVDLQGRSAEIDEYLKILGLDEKVSISGNRYSTLNLSTGQRKRLALLQCYLEDYPICLFDEWAADQDPEYRRFFYRELLPRMRAEGKMIIAVTHDEHYFDVADTVMKIDRQGIRVLENSTLIFK